MIKWRKQCRFDKRSKEWVCFLCVLCQMFWAFSMKRITFRRDIPSIMTTTHAFFALWSFFLISIYSNNVHVGNNLSNYIVMSEIRMLSLYMIPFFLHSSRERTFHVFENFQVSTLTVLCTRCIVPISLTNWWFKNQ